MEIWKFEFHSSFGPQDIHMPEGAKILHVNNQRGSLCLWAEVDPARPKERRAFAVIGTGHPFEASDPMTYLGTTQFDNGYLVLHVYEIENPAKANGEAA